VNETPGAEGLFHLRRCEASESTAAQPDPVPEKVKGKRPWWGFWP
jgi:hypothetical protein